MFGHVFHLLAAHAEGQLEDRERHRVERHLLNCVGCTRELERIRRGVALASTLGAQPMPEEVGVRIRRHFDSGTSATGVATSARVWRTAAAAILVIASTIALYWHVNRPWIRWHAASAAPTAFERQGRQLHDRIKSGDARLAFHAADERALWRWLASERAPVTGMTISRPDAQRGEFVAVGAAVHTLDGARTSVLSYRIDGRPVTLALASSRDVADAPPPGWWSKRVTHRREPGGINTLTWTVGGGTYVMVSELGGAGQKACLICHTAPRFSDAVMRLPQAP